MTASAGEVAGALGPAVLEDLAGAQDEQDGQGGQDDRRGHGAEQQPANQRAEDTLAGHQRDEASVLTQDDEAAVAAVSGERDEHRRERHSERDAAGELDVQAVSSVPTWLATSANLAGAREPRLLAAYANLLATLSGEADLRRAIEAFEKALLSGGGSTFEGGAELGAKRAQLLHPLERLRERPSDDLDEEGNPIPTRRHHPEAPRRTRPYGFSVAP